MESAFGVDHGEVSKALAGLIPQAGKALARQGKGFKAGYGLARSNQKAARASAGLPTTMKGNFQRGLAAGRAGGPGAARGLARQDNAIRRTAQAKTMGQIRSLQRPA